MDDLKKICDELYKKRLASLKDNENYLLCMVHLYGALRSSYYFNLTVHFKKLDQKKFNYLYIPKTKTKGDAIYYVYDDKVSDTKSHFNPEIKVRPALKLAFYESFQKFPREYLFPDFKNELIFNRMIKKLIHPHTNNQILRVSYETERYLEVALIDGDYGKFANESKLLRHNVHIVMTTYLKSIHELPKLRLKLIEYYTKEGQKLQEKEEKAKTKSKSKSNELPWALKTIVEPPPSSEDEDD